MIRWIDIYSNIHFVIHLNKLNFWKILKMYQVGILIEKYVETVSFCIKEKIQPWIGSTDEAQFFQVLIQLMNGKRASKNQTQQFLSVSSKDSPTLDICFYQDLR